MNSTDFDLVAKQYLEISRYSVVLGRQSDLYFINCSVYWIRKMQIENFYFLFFSTKQQSEQPSTFEIYRKNKSKIEAIW